MKKILFFCFSAIYSMSSAQTELVFVFFKDKPNKAAFYANPLSELSQKSLNRRTTLGIPLNDQDAPIEPSYIQNIQNLGFVVTDYSKWLNGVAVNATSAQITTLQSQSYVSSVESFVKNSSGTVKPAPINKWDSFDTLFNKNLTTFDYGSGSAQIDQINLRPLHLAGYTGTGVSIAVIDTGFPTVDTGSAFSRLWTNNQIKDGYDFVTKNANVYNLSLNNHGSIVLGAIGGYITNTFVGTAPDADFYLYRSENAAIEIPEEELYWIEAAEEADRKGVDIITTSLGYSVFDDSRYDYTYSDMNGNTSFIARGSEIASNKGIFVLNAAGNSGMQTWHYITTPADNIKVFSVGAVDSSGNPSSFTSYGPNSAGMIKPDGSTRGTSAATVYDNSLSTASGTSIATPIAAGGVTCLIQAFPTMNRELIATKLRQTASLFPSYNDRMGYGILNFGNFYTNNLNTSENTKKEKLTIFPNPAKSMIYITSDFEIVSIEVYDHLGRPIKQLSGQLFINIEDLTNGTYYLKIQGKYKSYYEKFIKI
ncbi:T9SS C-terminal target domain-containing protein [Chryseobacterium nematophagum]|uniref:T9SS C-terminal target domain-containing protein n=1 Tax=Chryseobacterium nematophagum TaxID=2305228 RepID=A0A3M7LDS2_9FLAO|nr:S8/S53 family peptidase [Chryseobacterium nematophagum]RMZ60235.1 T9SS C-terminal target domain-containing protein [Chryseobacterium nematophagum]